MKRTDYLSNADPLDRAAHARQSQLAEVQIPRRHHQILGWHSDIQLNADLTGAVLAQIHNQRRGAGFGPDAGPERNIQPVIAGRFPPELPGFGRARPKLQAPRVRGERPYPETDGQAFTRLD